MCSGGEGTIESSFGSGESSDRNNREGAETGGQDEAGAREQERWEVTRGERRKQEPEKDGVHKKPGRETPFPREKFPYIVFDMETLRISPPNTGQGWG